MNVVIGSARIDERGKASGGKLGDNNKKEVATQNFYVSGKGWYILRPVESITANKLAEAMAIACDNDNIGYDQSNRLDIISKGVNTTKPCEADCSSLVRACCKYAGFDPGNFTTANEASVLEATKIFQPRIPFVSLAKTPLCKGDVLVTKTKGHTVIVVIGNPRITQNELSYIFDPKFYYANNRDLAMRGIYSSSDLQKHFIDYGMGEGRWAHPNFHVQTYAARYSDLRNAFKNNWTEYFMHYIHNGIREGRSGKP